MPLLMMTERPVAKVMLFKQGYVNAEWRGTKQIDLMMLRIDGDGVV